MLFTLPIRYAKNSKLFITVLITDDSDQVMKILKYHKTNCVCINCQDECFLLLKIILNVKMNRL